MEIVKDILNFCNDAIFYDYKNIGIIEELNQNYKCIINRFYKTIPYTRILVSLSIIDDIILKIHSNEIGNILENIHNIRGNIIYMLSCEKTVNDEKQKVVDDDDDDKDEYKYRLPIFKLYSSK